MINELHYNLRIKKENFVLAGLWFGKSKPQPNLFFSVLRNTLRKLYKGVYFITKLKQKIKVRALIRCGTLDMQAKGLFLNLKLYSGSYGSQKCKTKGERGDNVQVYPNEENLDLRATSETIKFAERAKSEKTDFCWR